MRRRAYTLAELLIVVAILGLAGALLVPMLGDRGDFDVQAAVRRLVADLTFAQNDALANQEHRRLIFLPDENEQGRFRGWCIVRLTSSQLGLQFDPDTAVYVNDPLAPGGVNGSYIVDLYKDGRFGQSFIASVDLDNGSPMVTYDELGGTVTATGQPGSGGEIVIRGGNVTYKIMINGITGKISVADITAETLQLETGGIVQGGG